mmetsp:Transcript_29085/g.86131  ORF Transcript_29085/g.86131 Transcript_29085/m.86131 type:complete len:239 (-) Transcript_29085:473-1189(-)
MRLVLCPGAAAQESGLLGAGHCVGCTLERRAEDMMPFSHSGRQVCVHYPRTRAVPSPYAGRAALGTWQSAHAAAASAGAVFDAATAATAAVSSPAVLAARRPATRCPTVSLLCRPEGEPSKLLPGTAAVCCRKRGRGGGVRPSALLPPQETPERGGKPPGGGGGGGGEGEGGGGRGGCLDRKPDAHDGREKDATRRSASVLCPGPQTGCLHGDGSTGALSSGLLLTAQTTAVPAVCVA